MDGPRDRQASKPAASISWRARREDRAAALLLGQPAASGLQHRRPSWMSGAEAAAWGHIWGVEGPYPRPSPAPGGESLEPLAISHTNSLLHPWAPGLYSLASSLGTPLAAAQDIPPAPAAQPAGLRDRPIRLGAAMSPAALSAASFPQSELPTTPIEHHLPESGPYCPTSGLLAASLGTDGIDEMAVGDILLEIRQTLLSLPTKADLQALIADITASSDGSLGGEERDRGSGASNCSLALQGPQALSGLPTTLAPPEPEETDVRLSKQFTTRNTAVSGPPLIPRSGLILAATPFIDTPGDLWDLEDSLGLAPFLLDTTSSFQLLWVDKARGPLQQAANEDLSPLNGPLERVLPLLLTTAAWYRDALQSNSLKLREAGALYRWGSILLCQFGTLTADLWELLPLYLVMCLSNGLPHLDYPYGLGSDSAVCVL